MIKAEFNSSSGLLTGFKMHGHSGYAEQGADIVCAAASSAAYMTANTLTEIIGVDPEITVDDGFMEIKLTQKDAEKAKVIMDGFHLHMLSLQEQYSKYIRLKTSEV